MWSPRVGRNRDPPSSLVAAGAPGATTSLFIRSDAPLLLAGRRVLCLAGDPRCVGFAPAPRGRRDPVAPASQEHRHVLSVGTTPGSLTARWARPGLDHRRALRIHAIPGRREVSQWVSQTTVVATAANPPRITPQTSRSVRLMPQLLSARETRAADGRGTLALRNAVVKTGVPICMCQRPCRLRDDRARVRMRA